MIKPIEQEEKLLERIELQIGHASSRVIDLELINHLVGLPYDELISLCNINDQTNVFLHTDSALSSAMAKRLRESSYISTPVQSMDGKEKHDVFDHYVAALMIQVYFTQLPAAPRSIEVKKACLQIIDQACQLGLYNGLVIRLKQAISQATQRNLPVMKREEKVQLMGKTSNQLTNLYWSIGYLQAGSLWQSLGDYFFDQEETKEYGLSLHDRAFKDFLCAFLLRDHPMSASIMDSLTQGKGLASLSYEGNASIQTWDEFQTMVYDWVDGEKYARALALAEQEVKNRLGKAKGSEVEWKKAA